MKNKTKIFEAEIMKGYDITVYRYGEGKIYVEESSVAMVPEEERDFAKNRREDFNSWEDWWEKFKTRNCIYWATDHHPKFIHESIAESVEKSLIELFHDDNSKEDDIRNWFRLLNKPFELKPVYKKLKEVAKVIVGIEAKRNAKHEGGLVYISPHNIGSKELIFRRTKIVADTPQHRRALLKKGDIILVGVGFQKNIADYHIYDLPLEAVAGAGTFIIRPHDDYVLKRWNFRRYLLNAIDLRLRKSVGFRYLTITDIENLEI